jgi:hypothetical protein
MDWIRLAHDRDQWQALVYMIMNCVGFEVLTVVVMKSTIFWDITPCSLLRINRCFGGTYCLQLQGQKIS